jgi:hypothetical protein
MREIRGLTLHRPWAWAMTRGSKRIENRVWAPPPAIVGGYVALHAGKTWDYEGAEYIRRLHPEMPGSASEHPLGIVGVARVVDVILEERDNGFDEDPLPEDQDRWFFGPFGWLLADVVAIPPVPCRGMQGLWPLPADVLARVRELYAEARRGV